MTQNLNRRDVGIHHSLIHQQTETEEMNPMIRGRTLLTSVISLRIEGTGGQIKDRNLQRGGKETRITPD